MYKANGFKQAEASVHFHSHFLPNCLPPKSWTIGTFSPGEVVRLP